jgi:hypothetical protein
MNNLFIPANGLATVIDGLDNSCLCKTNWLFVNLDSAYGEHLLKVRQFLSQQLQKNQIEFWWEDEGLWLPGKELVKDFVIYKVIVTFSAAFIFPSTVKSCAKPQFHDTTDQGEFTEFQLKAVSQEIDRLKAKAYVAAGCGLQCVFADENLYQVVQRQSGKQSKLL